MWTRRDLLTAALVAAATALLPGIDVGRPGEEWVAEAVGIDRGAEEWGPAATLANAGGLLHRLDVAIARAPREFERRPLHVAAAIAGAVAGRTARWTGDDPSSYLTTAGAHATAAHDGPATASVLVQEANVVGVPARWTGLPQPREEELAARAVWMAGASSSTSGLRAAARSQLAWERAAVGDQHGALKELDWGVREAQRAGWGSYSLDIMHGEVMARCGHHAVARHYLTHALAAPPVRRIVVLTDLALCEMGSGDADAAATSLEEAVHLVRVCGAPGRLAGILTVRALLPPGRHRDQLDDVIGG